MSPDGGMSDTWVVMDEQPIHLTFTRHYIRKHLVLKGLNHSLLALGVLLTEFEFNYFPNGLVLFQNIKLDI